jgi:shikimate dehydrogenase
MTDRYAVIGNPIAHSKSPLIHSSFAQQTGQDISYEAVLGGEGMFARDVDALRGQGNAQGNGQGLKGLNITVPFKLDAFAYATQLSERAQQAGAVNALKFDGDTVLGENFDGIGLVNDIQRNLGVALRGKRVLILGAGGATRGALGPLAAALPRCVAIANRTVDKAQQLIASASAQQGVALVASGYADIQGSYDVIINATSASLFGELPPLAHSVFAPGCLGYDMVYGKGATPFLQLARQAGAAQLADGVGMLVEQAAEAFAWWRGMRPDTGAVIALISVPIA